jgi:hypothetical protein
MVREAVRKLVFPDSLCETIEFLPLDFNVEASLGGRRLATFIPPEHISTPV